MSPPAPIFNVICPALNRTVILKSQTWHYKILGPAGHSEMRGKERLLERIVASATSDDMWLDRAHPRHKPFIQAQVPDFLQANRFIRIGLEIESDNTAVITTALAVNSYPIGVMRYV